MLSVAHVQSCIKPMLNFGFAYNFAELSLIKSLSTSKCFIFHHLSLSFFFIHFREEMLEELPWDTIEMICHYLSLRDLSHLRLVSNSCRDIVISYYSRMKFIQASKLRSTSNRTFEKELKFVLNHCGNLRVAILSGCNFLSDDVVISVLSRNPNLRVLDLSNCSRLKSAALQPLVNKLQNLKKLYLSKCSWVTPGVIECIAMKRRELEVLDLSSCVLLTDQALSMLFTACCYLEEVNLSHIPSVSEKTLNSLISHCRKLKKVTCQNCQNLSAECKQKIKQLGFERGFVCYF